MEKQIADQTVETIKKNQKKQFDDSDAHVDIIDFANESNTGTEKVKSKYFGEEVLPNFERGEVAKQAFCGQDCIWDTNITYELQVCLLYLTSGD